MNIFLFLLFLFSTSCHADLTGPGTGIGNPITGGVSGEVLYTDASGNMASIPAQRLFKDTTSFLPNGTTTYVKYGANLQFGGNQAFTISIWRKGLTAGFRAMVTNDRGDAATNGGYWFAEFSGNLSFSIHGTPVTDQLRVETTAPTVSNNTAWNNLVVSYNGNKAPSGVAMYVDGTLATNTTITNTLTSNLLTYDVGGELAVSKFFTGSDYADAARFDELAIFNVALNASEVSALRSSGKPANLFTHSRYADLQLWSGYEFDFIDRKGNYNGTPVGLVATDFLIDIP